MAERKQDWSREFEDPISLPGGRKLVTLRDAADYITCLPKKGIRLAGMASRDRSADAVQRRRAHDDGADRAHASAQPSCRAGVQSRSQRDPLGKAEAEERPMTVFVYVNTTKQVGDPDHLKVFANADAAEKWFEENDPEGVAFEYKVLE
jgi:hypothetical protein